MPPEREALETAVHQSAVDLGATPADFCSDTNLCTAASASKDRRRWLPDPPLCQLVSYSENVVACAAPALVADIRTMLASDCPAWMFFQPRFTDWLAQLLQARGISADLYLDTCFLPAEPGFIEVGRDYTVEFLAGDEIAALDPAAWSNALSQDHPERDVLAVGAFKDGKLVALAGCSEECAAMWQIGVDVRPGYRRQGLGSALVCMLAAMTFEHGRVPYYTAASANLASVHTAAAAGFHAAWVQLTAMPRL